MLTDDQVAQFKRDGYLLLKGVLTPDEVTRFKEIGGTKNSDLAALPGLDTFWADGRLLSIARRLLGEPITFFGEASFRGSLFENDDQGGGRLHHDAKGTVEHLFSRQHRPTPEPYPIIRFAFYLQDHVRYSGGLKLVPGSHQMDSSHFDFAALPYLDVPSEPGDAVVFCNKILHAALAIRPKNGPGISPVEQAVRYGTDPGSFLERQRERRVIFIDYAGNNELADIYIKSRALNPSNLRDGFADLVASPAFQQAAARADIRLRLDAAVVECVTKIYLSAEGGKVTDTTLRHASALPALCRQSQSWSPHYDFMPAAPSDDSAETGLALAAKIGPNIQRLRKHLQTVPIDVLMTPQGQKLVPVNHA